MVSRYSGLDRMIGCRAIQMRWLSSSHGDAYIARTAAGSAHPHLLAAAVWTYVIRAELFEECLAIVFDVDTQLAWTVHSASTT